jgi:hypothetical protein
MSDIMKNASTTIVAADLTTIHLGNLFTVDTHLTLPVRGALGSSIAWVSSASHIIQDNGRIARPEAGQGDAKVTLTATASYGDMTLSRSFDVTVIQQETPKPISSLISVTVKTPVSQSPELPTYIVSCHPDGTYGTAQVMWDSFSNTLLTQPGHYTLQGTVQGTPLRGTCTLHILSDISYAKRELDCLKVHPFSLNDVQLEDAVFGANRDRAFDYLLSINDDRMLYAFKEAAGLSTKGAAPLGGWDAPACNLRGHTTGHYLTALGQAYASSGNPLFKAKIDYIIAELKTCQDGFTHIGTTTKGFLSAYSEDQFIQLEALVPYPQIWAPYYTLHKIMAGLLDCYTLADNSTALAICQQLGDFVYTRLSRLSKDKRNQMWATYIAGEYGGMNETLSKLYQLTGNQNALMASKFFDNDKLYVPMASGYDTLGNMHANQHIPQVIGALEQYAATGERPYFDIATHFWSLVTSGHCYAIGGTGAGEMFKERDQIARYLTDKTAETCASYNLLKLTRQLFTYAPEAKYMDYYERTLYNHILASQDQSAPNGGATYFMPLYPGLKKDFFEEENSCCHGTGMENHTKYQDSIYFKTPDFSALYVNLYIASTVHWTEKALTLTQRGHFLTDQAMTLTMDYSGPLSLHLRIPSWAEKGCILTVNGIPEDIKTTPGTYAVISRTWSPGDTLELSIPFSFRIEQTPDDPSIVSLHYGPLVMVAISDVHELQVLTLNHDGLPQGLKSTENPLHFHLADLSLIPNYQAYDCPYHAYFKVV